MPVSNFDMADSNRGALAPLSINALLNSPQASTTALMQNPLKPLQSFPAIAPVPLVKAGTKRPAPSDDPKGMSEEDAEYWTDCNPIDKSCNQMRTQIRNFIEAGGMKVGECQKTIGNGPYGGENTATSGAAWAFFKKRELMGVPMPKKAKKTATAPAPIPGMVGRAADMPSVAGSIDTAKTGPLTAQQLKNIDLPGQASDAVEIYDDCDDIRRKISAHLSQPGTTAAQLCRDMAAMYTLEPGKKIQSKVLNDFRNKKGPLAGNTSSVFYGAYCYFEKVRMAEGKPKTAKRQKNEKGYASEGGVNRTDRESFWTFDLR